MSLFGIKLGDDEAKALDGLVNRKIPGIKAEQSHLYFSCSSAQTEAGPMAGVRVQDGKKLISSSSTIVLRLRHGIFPQRPQ